MSQNYRKDRSYKLDENYSDYKKIGAHIISNSGSNWFSDFTIDKGSKDGIKKNCNVLAGSGLVGIVTEVGPHYARVRSIIDDESNISAMPDLIRSHKLYKFTCTPLLFCFQFLVNV